jgi:3-isopropylmalate dehydrogenase
MSDKSNVLTYGHDLWQRTFKDVAARYPEIESNHLYVDVLAMWMVLDPGRFDVIVTNNLFGDIVSDIGAALQGGLGMAASGNINPGKLSLFEPVHGSAPQFAGKNIANPIAAVLTAAMMLEYLGYSDAAAAIEASVERAVEARQTTGDIGGALTTREAGEAIRRQMSDSR